MQTVSEFKGIRLSNIPQHNLRSEFFEHYHLVKSREFIDSVKQWKPGTVISTPYVSWHSWPEQFFTFLSQLSILGVECYVTGAVFYVLGSLRKLKENMKYLRNPFSIPGGKGTATKYYKLMPSLASEEIALPNANPRLWADVQSFYKGIRNPLFHGMQLNTRDPVDLVNILELIADIYAWIDSWHNPDDVIKGSSWFTKLNRS